MDDKGPALAIAVTGPSRGLGVTSVALHLAAAAGIKRSTCLLDLDIAWCGAAARLALDGGVRRWSDPTPGEGVRLNAVPVAGGFRLLAAPQTLPATPPVADVLDAARREFGRVVVDLPPLAPARGEVLRRCAAAVVVVAPTAEGVSRARTALSELDAPAVAVVLNRLGPGGDLTRAELESRLGHPVSIELPCTPRLRDAEDEGRLIIPGRSRWARRIERLAKRLFG